MEGSFESFSSRVEDRKIFEAVRVSTVESLTNDISEAKKTIQGIVRIVDIMTTTKQLTNGQYFSIGNDLRILKLLCNDYLSKLNEEEQLLKGRKVFYEDLEDYTFDWIDTQMKSENTTASEQLIDLQLELSLMLLKTNASHVDIKVFKLVTVLKGYFQNMLTSFRKKIL